MSDSDDDAAFASADEGEETKQSSPKGDKSTKPDTDKATKSVGKGDNQKQAPKTNPKSEKEATDKTKNPEVSQQKGATGKGKKKGKQAKKNNKSTEKHETKETESKKPESEVAVKEEEKPESKKSDIENQEEKTPDSTPVEEKKEPENNKELSTDSTNVSEITESIVKSPSGQNIQREGSGEGSEKPDIKSVLDQLADDDDDDDDDDEKEEEEEDQKSSSWNIGGWGSSIMNVAQTSVSTFTNQVGEGFSTIMDTMENTLGAIPPEQLAYMKTDKKDDEALESHDVAHTMKPAESASKEITEQPKHVEPGEEKKAEEGSDDKKTEKAEEAKEDTASGGGGWFSSWGMSSLKDAVTKTSNIVQSTSKNLVTGSMDVLETVGKKAFDFIEDHDPGIHRSKVLLERGDKPNLSSVLKEAKEESEYKQEMEKESEEARKSHFGYLFDEFQGISHLEALEILSNQCEKKVQILLTSLPAETLSSIKSQLIQIKQIFEHENDDDDDDEEQEHEFIKVMTELLTDLHLGTTPNKINKVQENIRKEITDFYEKQEKGEKVEPKLMHQKAIQSLAQLTSKAMEQFHKAGELILIQKDSDKNFIERAKCLLSINKLLSTEVSILSTKFSHCLNKLGEDMENDISINQMVTNVYLEATNSSTYIHDGFQLLLPCLQQAAIENTPGIAE